MVVKKFSPERIQGVAGAASAANTAIATELEALDERVRVLRAGWTGAASDAYDEAHRQWTAQLNAMNKILASASNAAAKSSERYASGRAKIQERWK
jgi:WXG100 family type VII secretion target